MRRAILRVDANESVGVGHAMRMLSLGDELRANGWETIFCGLFLEVLEARINTSGHKIVDPEVDGQISTHLRVSSHFASDWVILDGYLFDIDFHRSILAAGWRLLVMDDHCHHPVYAADLVVNQNAGAETFVYPLERSARVLVGARYALLRSEFNQWRIWERTHPDQVNNVLVTFGGGDSSNALFEVIRALNCNHRRLCVRVIAGAANSGFDEIVRAAAAVTFHEIEVLHYSNNMPGLMAWADMAITAGGSTLWECAFMALPTVVLCLADNQRGGADAMDKAGAANNLGDFDGVTAALISTQVFKLVGDKKKRTSMGVAGHGLVDGLGAKRVRVAMETIK